MRTIQHNNTWSLLLLLLFVCTNFAWAEPQEAVRKKEFNQSYAARPGNQLAIENKYGNITITHWQKDEIAIRVVVEAKARSEAQAQQMLERIDITIKKSGNVVLGATEIHSSSNNGSFSVNYYVSMPTWIDLDLHQKYGNILLPKENNKGKCLLEVKYGNIEGGTFTQPLEVEAKYSNVKLGTLTSANLTLGYSGKTIIEKAEELQKTIPGSIIAGQFSNKANAEAHYRTTGPEIWEDAGGNVDIFVAGVGTGGTITGTGRYLREKNKDIHIIAVEPDASPVLSGGRPGAHAIQGIGAGFIPQLLDVSVYNEVRQAGKDDAFRMARLLAAKEGIFCGISSGAALSVAAGAALNAEGKTVVAVLPDSGDRYLSGELWKGEY